MSNPDFCTIHSQPMRWMESKTKFNEDGSAKTYLAHRTIDGKMCFGKGENGNYSSPKSFEKSIDDKPDWDEIAKGKVRHGFAIEAFKLGMPLDNETKDIIDRWVEFVITDN